MKISHIKLIVVLVGLLIVAGVLYFAVSKLLGPKQPVGKYTLPYVQNFDDVDLSKWFTKGGVWTLRENALSQTIGGEEPGFLHIPLKLIDDTPYHVSVYLTLKKDTKSAGLSFNAQYPNLTEQQQRVYLYQPAKDKLELVAGYMDETGSFVPQAQVPLSLNTTEFRLDLFVYENTYLVQLNGQRLIDKRPLFYRNGMVGFYAVGPAIFDNFEMVAADSSDPGDQVYTSDFDSDPGGAGWVPFSGDWRLVNGQMTQTNVNAIDAGIGYETSSFHNFVMQTSFSVLQGAGAGVLFNMPSPYQVNGAQLVRYSDETDALIWGAYDSKGIFTRQGYVAIAPPATGPHIIKIFSGENSYDIFLDEQLIARSVALISTQGSVGLLTSHASAAYARVEVFPLFGSSDQTPRQLTPVLTKLPATANPAIPTTAASTTALPKATAIPGDNPNVVGGATKFKATFTGDIKKSGWKVIAGDWVFSNGNLNETSTATVDDSIIYTGAAYRNFSLEVGLTHQQGFGAGVLFNMPYTDRLNGAYLVRYTDRRPGAIFWGRFDDTGKFIGEGYANVTEASTDRHIFRIVSKDKTYDVYLDNKLVVKDQPLEHNYGYMGLLTSKASVSYDLVSLDGTNAAATNSQTTTDGFSDVRILSGKWDTNGSNITQQVPDLGDYILNSGVFAQEYTVEATISQPVASDTGGGFIFHMPDRGSRKGAYLVRLTGGGTGIFWGHFDDAGKFQGQGSVPLKAATSYIMKLMVSGNKMDVFIDGKPIFQNIAIGRNEGWLGLIAHGGVIKFEKVKVTITGLSGTP